MTIALSRCVAFAPFHATILQIHLLSALLPVAITTFSPTTLFVVCRILVLNIVKYYSTSEAITPRLILVCTFTLLWNNTHS